MTGFKTNPINSSKDINNEKERFSLELQVNLEKEDFLGQLRDFYHLRKKNVEGLLERNKEHFSRKTKKFLRDLIKRIETDEKEYCSSLTSIFFAEFYVDLMKRVAKSPYFHTISISEDEIMNVDLEIPSLFSGSIKITPEKPQEVEKRTLFGTKTQILYSPFITFVYEIQGEGNLDKIKEFRDIHINPSLPPELRSSFYLEGTYGEKVEVFRSRKQRENGKIEFERFSCLMTLPEERIKILMDTFGAQNINYLVETLFSDYFKKFRGGLLKELNKDDTIGHEVEKDNEGFLIKVRTMDGFDGKIYLPPWRYDSSIYETELRISGSTSKESLLEAFLKRYSFE